jgi:hypothetical protein
MPPPRPTDATAVGDPAPPIISSVAPLQVPVPLKTKVNVTAGAFSMAMPSSPEQSPQPTGGVAALRKVHARRHTPHHSPIFEVTVHFDTIVGSLYSRWDI